MANIKVEKTRIGSKRSALWLLGAKAHDPRRRRLATIRLSAACSSSSFVREKIRKDIDNSTLTFEKESQLTPLHPFANVFPNMGGKYLQTACCLPLPRTGILADYLLQTFRTSPVCCAYYGRSAFSCDSIISLTTEIDQFVKFYYDTFDADRQQLAALYVHLYPKPEAYSVSDI